MAIKDYRGKEIYTEIPIDEDADLLQFLIRILTSTYTKGGLTIDEIMGDEIMGNRIWFIDNGYTKEDITNLLTKTKAKHIVSVMVEPLKPYKDGKTRVSYKLNINGL